MPALLESQNEYLISSNSSKVGEETDSTCDSSFRESPYSSCFEKLFEIVGNCSDPGWDGYEALPIVIDVYFKIISLICNFPEGLAAPDLVPENDGAITLEWHKNNKQEVSISINPNDKAYYAFVDGSEKKHGSCVLQESMPPFLIQMINQVLDD